MDAVRLWAETQKGNTPGQGEELQAVVRVLERQLKLVDEIDRSLAYLESVSNGGLVKRLLFLLDQTGASLVQAQRPFWPSGGQLRRQWGSALSLVEMSTCRLQSARQDLLRSIGVILAGKQQAAIGEEDHMMMVKVPPLIRPWWISRYFYPVCIYGAALWALLRVSSRLDLPTIVEGVTGAYSACRYLLLDWVVSPLQEIWKTIRYRSTSLALVSAAALKADMASLERMVVDFAARKHPQVPPDAVLQQVRQGDVTLLLRSYEAELQAPLRNALLGDLISMLLIQVQKTKVDLEAAMMAMDRLLKANELNFELLAVIPLLALLYYSIGTGRYYLRRWLHRSERNHQARLRRELHRLATILNAEPDESIRAARVLISVQSLLQHWHRLPAARRGAFEAELSVDLQELLQSQPSAEQKLWTISRMRSYYPMLALPEDAE